MTNPVCEIKEGETYEVVVSDRAFQGKKVFQEVCASEKAAKARASEIRGQYKQSRYDVAYQVDPNLNNLNERFGPSKRWLHLVTQDFSDLRKYFREKEKGLVPIKLPAFKTSLADARRFFWSLVRAKSRRQRKAMANALADFFMEVSREDFEYAWNGSEYSGSASVLDPSSKFYVNPDRFKKPRFFVADEAPRFFGNEN